MRSQAVVPRKACPSRRRACKSSRRTCSSWRLARKDCPHCAAPPRTSPRTPPHCTPNSLHPADFHALDEFAGLHPVECCRDELGQPTRRVGSEAPGLHGHQRSGQALAAAGAGAALATYMRMPSPRHSLQTLAAFCRAYLLAPPSMRTHPSSLLTPT